MASLSSGNSEARFTINVKEGIVELEGKESFVDKHLFAKVKHRLDSCKVLSILLCSLCLGFVKYLDVYLFFHPLLVVVHVLFSLLERVKPGFAAKGAILVYKAHSAPHSVLAHFFY